MYGIVYIAINEINNKIYIGQTTYPLKRRIAGHLSKASKNSDYYFHRAIRKYGKDNFTWKVLIECENQDELNKQEAFFISEKNACDSNLGYNMREGGIQGGRPSTETKEKIRQKSLEQWKRQKEEGFTVSESTKAKLKEKAKGRIISKKQRQASRDALLIKLPKDIIITLREKYHFSCTRISRYLAENFNINVHRVTVARRLNEWGYDTKQGTYDPYTKTELPDDIIL